MRTARLQTVFALLLLPALHAAYTQYEAARRKFDLIESGRLKPGSTVTLTPQELNAFVQTEVPRVVPEGVRNPRVELGAQTATGSALVDFNKLRRAQGKSPSWLMSQLLDGEKPVKVTARIRSGSGKATVDVERVEVAGIPIEGRLLDYLIRNYLVARYPSAKIGEPFALSHHIEKLDVGPSAVHVLIGK